MNLQFLFEAGSCTVQPDLRSLDPSHTRPVPPPLLLHYLKETGFGRLEIRYSHPAAESFPSLAELPKSFRRDFFSCLDYAVLGRKL